MSKRTGNPAVAIRVPERLMSDLETRLEVLSHLEEEPSPGVRPGIATVVRRDLERYYQLIRDELRHLPLERQEILLILDALNGVSIAPPGMARGAVLVNVRDHIQLNQASSKWGVDGEELMIKLGGMSPGTLMALADLGERFWARPEEDTDELLRALGVRGWTT